MNYVVSSFIDINDDNYDDDDFDSRTRAYYYNYYNTQRSYNGKETNTGEHEFVCQRYKIILYPRLVLGDLVYCCYNKKV